MLPIAGAVAGFLVGRTISGIALAGPLKSVSESNPALTIIASVVVDASLAYLGYRLLK